MSNQGGKTLAQRWADFAGVEKVEPYEITREDSTLRVKVEKSIYQHIFSTEGELKAALKSNGLELVSIEGAQGIYAYIVVQ